MSRESDDELLARVREQLDQSVASLDGETRSRLTAARHRAIEGNRSGYRRWLQAGGFALASLLLIALTVPLILPSEGPLEIPVALFESSQDLELVSTVEDLELLEELDFYYWLEEGGQDAG